MGSTRGVDPMCNIGFSPTFAKRGGKRAAGLSNAQTRAAHQSDRDCLIESERFTTGLAKDGAWTSRRPTVTAKAGRAATLWCFH